MDQKVAKPLEEMEISEETDENPSTSETWQTVEKIPPVVLRNTKNWTIWFAIKAKKIHYKSAKMLMNGVAIIPSSSKDYRSLSS